MNFRSGIICLMIGLLFWACSSQTPKEETPFEKNIEAVKSIDTNHLPIINEPENEIKTEEDTSEFFSALMEKKFPDYDFLYYETGNLDKDNQDDAVVVVEKKCEEDQQITDESKCRKVIFLKNKALLNYEIVTTSDHIISCSDCGMRNIPQIVIKNGYISFENLFGGCDKTFEVITFKYDATEKDWFLHRIGTENYSCREEDNPNDEIKVRSRARTKKDFGIIRFKDFEEE